MWEVGETPRKISGEEWDAFHLSNSILVNKMWNTHWIYYWMGGSESKKLIIFLKYTNMPCTLIHTWKELLDQTSVGWSDWSFFTNINQKKRIFGGSQYETYRCSYQNP